MTNNETLVSDEARSVLEQLALGSDINSRRAAALLAVAEGQTQAEAAAAVDLTEGQVAYALRRFHEQGVSAFAAAAEADDTTTADAESEAEQLRRMVAELDARVAELEGMVEAHVGDTGAYSPLRLLTTVRDNLQRLTPDMQLDVLRNFQGMSAEDMLDLDTWKGLAYMMTYSARFQAGQMRDKVSGAINHVVPEPIQPGRLWQMGKSSLERVTPEFAKQILGTLQGASREDLLDPDTWKGVFYMINYSLQFQAEQLKQRLSHADESSS